MRELPRKMRSLVLVHLAKGHGYLGSSLQKRARGLDKCVQLDAEDCVAREEENRDDIKTAYERAGLAKLPAALDWLSHLVAASAAPDKLVVFAHHRRVMRRLRLFAEERGAPYVFIDGETPPRDRCERLRSFRDRGAGIKLAIVSVTAGGQVCRTA